MPAADRRPPGRPGLPHGTSSFGFFSEVLLVGAVTAVLWLPLLTAVPATAAGVAHLRRHLEGRSDSLRAFWADFAAAARGGWLVSLVTLVVLAVLGFNLAVAGSGALPAAGLVQAVSGLVAAGVVVVALRTSAAWSPGSSWRAAARAGTGRAGGDLTGSTLLLVAVGLCLVIVWMLVALALIVPGLLALAVVAVEHRARTRGILPAP